MTRRTICIRKGCGKKLPKIVMDQGDEFCSTECARMHHGVPLTSGRKNGDNNKT